MTVTVSTHQSEEDIRNEDILIYLNGKILPKNEAVVSVYDSGFMLGDGVWEGLRLYNNKWAFCGEHIDRLFEAALAIDLDIGLSKSDVIDALIKTQNSNGMVNNAHARLMITRGPKKKTLSTSSIITRRAYICYYYGALCSQNTKAHIFSDSASFEGFTNDARPKVKQPFKT